MGCDVLLYFRELVDIVQRGLLDGQMMEVVNHIFKKVPEP